MTIPPRLFLAVSACLVTVAMLASAAFVMKWQSDATGARSGVHSDNEARRIVDARVAPYSAVGRVKGTMLCTAEIVLHPRIVLTAAHCVATGRRVVFQPGYQAGADLGRFEAAVWAIGARQDYTGQSVHDASNDWAILLLERAPIGVQPFLLSELSADGLRQLGQQILMPSYAVDVAAGQALSLDPACSVRKHAWNVLVHDCQTSSGGSGAPLLIRQGEEYAVVGVHTGAILERDEALHSMRLIGHEATGAWAFGEAIRALSARLKKDGSLDVAGPLAH
jgi:V8-like Glu-specific endopeptidase